VNNDYKFPFCPKSVKNLPHEEIPFINPSQRIPLRRHCSMKKDELRTFIIFKNNKIYCNLFTLLSKLVILIGEKFFLNFIEKSKVF
jgi:hypothetical protein